jgi:spoIIIJ-associated protein
MNASQAASEITDSLLGYLGFAVTVEETGSPEAPQLQVFTEESELLIGRDGERLEDLQFLVNRILHRRLPEAPRVRIDIGHYRAMQEDEMLNDIRHEAERVKNTGESAKLPPMNSYQRRLVHQLFKDDPDIRTWSPDGSSRFKCVTLFKK